MKKVFISQPMRGKTDEEILAERDEAIEKVKQIYDGEEIEIIDSFFKEAPADATPLWYLGDSIVLLSKADVRYFCNGWENARGCIIEYMCAMQYGIDIVLYNEVLLPRLVELLNEVGVLIAHADPSHVKKDAV